MLLCLVKTFSSANSDGEGGDADNAGTTFSYSAIGCILLKVVGHVAYYFLIEQWRLDMVWYAARRCMCDKLKFIDSF